MLVNSQSRAVLLDAEDATDATPGLSSPRSASVPDVEAANQAAKSVKTATDVAATASHPAEGCTSRCPPSPTVLNAPPKEAENGEDEDEEEQKNEDSKETSGSREAPAIMEILENDPHNFALKKMGVLTAIAIFIHNFPEGQYIIALKIFLLLLFSSE